jgi:peptide deformylase
MINPEILESDGPETLELEGNLCLPDVRAKVARRSSVTIRWQTVNSGQTLTRAFDGWEARVLQHELEVLDGVLFIDHADGASAGTWRSSQYQAERGVAAIYGEDDGAPRRGPGPLAIGTAAPGLLELDGTLRRPAAPVDVSAFAPDHLRALVESMLRAQHDARGVGLAAPQVGLALRLVVIDDHEGGPMALINPRILDRDEKTETGIEGCLSIPGWRAEVERSIAVKVETQTVHGEMLELDFRGHRARIAQHELDHLDGVLYTDRVAPDARLFPIDPDTTAEDTLARILKQEAAASHGTSGAAPPRRRRRGKRRR